MMEDQVYNNDIEKTHTGNAETYIGHDTGYEDMEEWNACVKMLCKKCECIVIPAGRHMSTEGMTECVFHIPNPDCKLGGRIMSIKDWNEKHGDWIIGTLLILEEN